MTFYIKYFIKPILTLFVATALLSPSLFANEPKQWFPMTMGDIIIVMPIYDKSIPDNQGIIHNGTTYGTVTSPYTGKVWLDRNLGASRVCTAYDDTACYGDYYQWGRNYDGHQRSTSSFTSTQATDIKFAGSSYIIGLSGNDYDWAADADSEGSLRFSNWSATDGSSVCPIGFRVPSLVELRVEISGIGATSSATPFSNFLKLPLAGYRYDEDSLENQRSWGYLWASTPIDEYSQYAVFSGGYVSGNYGSRAFGLSVRCVRD